ncbi:NTF2-related export protein 2 isoform X2 [Desmodus rotundus]|uniref:NTF2-related export protein 2 isoform X2 n=1 Tax=Desmodus rotundus TaxID=9430 RepID=UPI002380C668|nr:NTF2-related export protein 2 isoform X2 [Desmodus rotundus]
MDGREATLNGRSRTRDEVVTPPLPEQTTSGSPMATAVALTRLYLEKATLIWNGNVVTGLEALADFFDVLPSSQFQVNMLDCQPVHEQATQAQTTVLVVTSGTVKFDGNRQHYFNQNFLLTAQTTSNNTVWKIASDCFRFQDWASS